MLKYELGGTRGKQWSDNFLVRQLVRSGFFLCGRRYQWLAHKHQAEPGQGGVVGGSISLSSIFFATESTDGVSLQRIEIDDVRQWYVYIC